MKTLVKVLAVVAIVMFAGYNVHKSQNNEMLSEIAMANIQALASVEGLARNEAGSDVCTTTSGYSLSLKADGELQEYYHYNPGVDRVMKYDIVECIASGYGTLWGSPGIYLKMYKGYDFVTCTGLCNYPQLW